MAAPGWGDLADWLAGVNQAAAGGSRSAGVLAHTYEFLGPEIPQSPLRAVRRAVATVARFSDA